ncbi:hypothetical protein DPX39_100107800 [Trypanosoma brucei equiperdum]|uniref:Uncharacterized protein n=1 Tax=Trypanosoma brucei equiperdum TaxID=630700 RepID=A0A3L6KXI6_9TRYP|nr:hypothetical protein DPX39_100107800 [Trypanosoma brucei equiperdum]
MCDGGGGNHSFCFLMVCRLATFRTPHPIFFFFYSGLWLSLTSGTAATCPSWPQWCPHNKPDGVFSRLRVKEKGM